MCQLELPLFIEEVEECRCVDRRNVTAKLGKRFDLGQRGRGRIEGSVDGRVCPEEGRVECVSCYERDCERLGGGLEQTMSELPESWIVSSPMPRFRALRHPHLARYLRL